MHYNLYKKLDTNYWFIKCTKCKYTKRFHQNNNRIYLFF